MLTVAEELIPSDAATADLVIPRLRPIVRSTDLPLVIVQVPPAVPIEHDENEVDETKFVEMTVVPTT